jgi:hypothetical protein
MLPILPDTAWLEFRGAPPKKGQNQTTHQALVVDASGREHKCFVKASPDQYPMAFAEGLAWLLADALGLPRPNFAALLVLPVQKLKKHVVLDQYWMHRQGALAFCSSTVEGKHISSMWQWLGKLRQAKAFRHPDVARIAAFDVWADNQDRHTGNFLRTKGGDYVPIDNELVLYNLLWAPRGLTYNHNSLLMQAQGLLNSVGYTKFQDSVVVASEQHDAAFAAAAPALQQFINALNADPNPVTRAAFTAAILQFLGQRAHPGWVSTQLGLIP